MTQAIVYDASEVKCRAESLDEIWWQGRQWAVTTFGLEKRDGTYAIEANRLTKGLEDDDSTWVQHMGGKSWIDLEDFTTALFIAIAMHGHALTQPQTDILRDHFQQKQESIAIRPF